LRCRRPLVSFRSPSEYDRIGLCEASRCRTPLQGFSPYSACRIGKRHYPGFTGPGYAAPSGFPALLTLPSSRDLPAVFQTGNAPGIVPFEGFPSRGMARPLGRPCPPGVGSDGSADPVARYPRPPSGLSSPRKSVASLPTSGRCGPFLPWAFPPPGVFSTRGGPASGERLLP
jgi:hypothetical protein